MENAQLVVLESTEGSFTKKMAIEYFHFILISDLLPKSMVAKVAYIAWMPELKSLKMETMSVD